MKRVRRAGAVLLMALAVSGGCVIAPGPPDYGEVVAPPLPAIVELGEEPYYVGHGYHYYYHDERWHYARDRRGPWRELPRTHWPKETRFRGRGAGGESFRGQERR